MLDETEFKHACTIGTTTYRVSRDLKRCRKKTAAGKKVDLRVFSSRGVPCVVINDREVPLRDLHELDDPAPIHRAPGNIRVARANGCRPSRAFPNVLVDRDGDAVDARSGKRLPRSLCADGDDMVRIPFKEDTFIRVRASFLVRDARPDAD